MEEWRCKSTHS